MKSELKPQLKDGADWQQYDKFIVGDEAGLKNLIKACEKAIESGEYIGPDLGDYIGVKRMSSEQLADPQERKATPFMLTILFVIFLAFIMFSFVGVTTVWSWW